MKLDVSTALKSRSEKNAFSGAFCCCQLVWATCCNAGNGATLLLSSSVFVRACVCGCQSKREARPYMGKRYNRRKYSQMMARMKETSSQSTVEGCVPVWAASSNICRLHLPSALPILREESLQNWSISAGECCWMYYTQTLPPIQSSQTATANVQLCPIQMDLFLCLCAAQKAACSTIRL